MDNIKIYHHYFKWNPTLRIYVQIYLNMKHISKIFLFFLSKTSLLAILLMLQNEQVFCVLQKGICLHAVFHSMAFDYLFFIFLFSEVSILILLTSTHRGKRVFPEQNGFPNLSLFSSLVLKYVFPSCQVHHTSFLIKLHF